ncbi:MAG: DUF1343 domain-containing protein [Gemmataceae bacterium]
MRKTGLDRLREQQFRPLDGKRIGLLTHPAAVSGFDGDSPSKPLRTALELFVTAPNLHLAALFGPEHGLTGEAQDLIPVGETPDAVSPRPVAIHSLYGDSFASLKPTARMLEGLDLFVIDLQDVGSRYYTFQATMLYCLEACAAVGLPVLILDRPNPIGSTREGPTIEPGFESFVGPHPIPIRHGCTMGQLAKLYRAERVPTVSLEILACEGYGEHEWIPFVVSPSPNMPTRQTALVYPGMCLIEGTNLSEGRGTTRPFETVGFPGVNANVITKRLRDFALPGVDFLPATFKPTFQKHAGQSCGGVTIHVTDPKCYSSVAVGLAVIIAFRDLLGPAFHWRTERYEFVDHIPAIDLLFGSARERKAIEAGMPFPEILQPWPGEVAAFEKRISRN